jgi:hypothetical protein
MHDVVLDLVDLHRLERAQADVERHPPGVELGEDLRVKWRPAVGAAIEPSLAAKTVW